MIIFVGDKPSPRMKPGAKPFEGAACEKRLKEWIKQLNVDNFEIKNQCDIKGISYFCNEPTIVIALGNVASKVLASIPHFKLPHPSGRNRQLNDKEFIANKLKECKDYLRGFSENK